MPWFDYMLWHWPNKGNHPVLNYQSYRTFTCHWKLKMVTDCSVVSHWTLWSIIDTCWKDDSATKIVNISYISWFYSESATFERHSNITLHSRRILSNVRSTCAAHIEGRILDLVLWQWQKRYYWITLPCSDYFVISIDNSSKKFSNFWLLLGICLYVKTKLINL